MWIGLLYYFNVVQTPALAAAAADKGGPGGAGITKYIAPRALLWFRWAALATWLTGAWLPRPGASAAPSRWATSRCRPATAHHRHRRLARHHHAVQRLGLIWPNQKKILGIVPATDEEKAKARKVAMLASRINFVLSIPMLMCMAAASHGLPF